MQATRCEICNDSYGLQRHHKFSQTKWARKLYGNLIDDPKNIQWVCSNCHASHASLNLIFWSERDFCTALGITVLSKVGF